MWVFTKEGFFSVVWDRYCAKDQVMIKTHCKDDIINLSKKLWGYSKESEIVHLPHADYRFRLKIPKQMWSEYLAQSALKIDYDDVKSQIIPQDDTLRKNAYYEVWEALYRWQSKMIAKEDRQ